MLFLATKFVVLCYSNNKKLIQVARNDIPVTVFTGSELSTLPEEENKA